MSAPSLFPGYKQVESFGPEDEYESGEEVEYVTLDLGTIEPTLVPSSSTYRLIVSASSIDLHSQADMRRTRETGSRYAHSIPAALRDEAQGPAPVSARDGAPVYGN